MIGVTDSDDTASLAAAMVIPGPGGENLPVTASTVTESLPVTQPGLVTRPSRWRPSPGRRSRSYYPSHPSHDYGPAATAVSLSTTESSSEPRCRRGIGPSLTQAQDCQRLSTRLSRLPPRRPRAAGPPGPPGQARPGRGQRPRHRS